LADGTAHFMKITAGKFQKIYDPSVGMAEKWYINDHCFVQDDGGIWHMFGITHQEPAAPKDEKFFAHATSQELLNPQWEKHEHVLHADFERWQETHVWAPHVIKHDGLYYMYYCGGGTDDAKYKIHLATSPDLWDWSRHEANPMVTDGYHARDPMVIRHEDQWIMYYTANSEPAGGNHVVAAVTSRDLIHWGNKKVVFVHPKRGTYGGPTESPFVVKRQGRFYLFVCTNEPYNDSAVYESDNPWEWSFERNVGQAPSHASEVIEAPTGEWYLSRAGWGEGGLYLAPLRGF
jgi:predicted GH43/DUF377 family glycosyl hydrolase